MSKNIHYPSYEATLGVILGGVISGALAGARTGTLPGVLAGVLFGIVSSGVTKMCIDAGFIHASLN